MEVGKKWHSYISDIKSYDHILVGIRRVHLMSRQTSPTAEKGLSSLQYGVCTADVMWACATIAGVTQPRAHNYDHLCVRHEKLGPDPAAGSRASVL